MTQDDIIRMAREAGFTEMDLSQGRADILKDFAALVAAHEREACAQVCEKFGSTVNVETWDMAAQDCAAAIRVRSDK